MTWLALDTATDRPTLALGEPRGPHEEAALGHRHELSGRLDGAVRTMLAAHGVAAHQLQGVVVADGPGSFTGLRIGIAFAKGLCRAALVPLHTAPSLLGAARRAAPRGGLVVVDYDALRGEVYRGVYRLNGAITVLSAPALARRAAPLDGAWAAAVRAGEAEASAAALLDCLLVPGGATAVADVPRFEPTYGRPAEAEARLLARGQ